MSDALEEHERKVRIGGGTISDRQVAHDIYALAEEEEKLEALTDSLKKENLHKIYP